VDDDTLQRLRDLHPQGPRDPYHNIRPPSPPESVWEDVPQAVFDRALAAMGKYSAPGLSGWTVPLLRIAYTTPGFKAFISKLLDGIVDGTAPGQDIFTASCLIALSKPSGGIRPIAVGDTIYRFVMKVAVAHSFSEEVLAPFQFGVGSKGGVEPVVDIVRRALKGELPVEFLHLTSLDGINAFNEQDRILQAQSVAKHHPQLYKAAKWIHNSPTTLVYGSNAGKSRIVLSTQGVPQGSPSGPILFSIGIRDTLERLQEYLGPGYLIVAYLDDIFILSSDPKALTRVHAFFQLPGAGMRLNAAKCNTTSLRDIRANGYCMLGSCLGARHARASFLDGKVDEQEQILDALGTVHSKQIALLLLRQCVQMNLRHLQRSLETADIRQSWDRLDTRILGLVAQMRGSAPSSDVGMPVRDAIAQWPARMGGLGLLAHAEVSPMAFAAASDLSSTIIARIFPTIERPPPDYPSQRQRCDMFYTNSRETLMPLLSQLEQCRLVENSTRLATRWLHIHPTLGEYQIPNHVVASELAARTLYGGPDGRTCDICGRDYSFLHGEVCKGGGGRALTVRHNRIQWAIISTLRNVKGVSITSEPLIQGSADRNDILIRATASSGLSNRDIDVTVSSIAGTNRRISRDRPDARRNGATSTSEGAFLVDKAKETLMDVLNARAKVKDGKIRGHEAYYSASGHLYRTFNLTAGGATDEGTDGLIGEWTKAMGPFWAKILIDRMSLALINARAVATKV
jgi:hypothetical protein